MSSTRSVRLRPAFSSSAAKSRRRPTNHQWVASTSASTAKVAISISGCSPLWPACGRENRILEGKTREQSEAVVRTSAAMLLPPALDNRSVDALDVGACVWVERPQPTGKGDAEPLLAACQDGGGQVTCHHFLQQVLALSVPELEPVRETTTELHQVVVEKDCARFQRDHHAGTVDLGQDIILEVKIGEKLQGPIDIVLAAGLFPQR